MAVTIEPAAKADPCSLLWGSAKTKCEELLNGSSSGSGGTSGSGTSLLDLFTNPVQFLGGIRHFMDRIAEFVIGGLLVIIGVNALIKAQTSVDVVGSATKVAKKTAKASKDLIG